MKLINLAEKFQLRIMSALNLKFITKTKFLGKILDKRCFVHAAPAPEQARCGAGAGSGRGARGNFPNKLLLVPSGGIEPPFPASEAGVLSVERRGHFSAHYTLAYSNIQCI